MPPGDFVLALERQIRSNKVIPYIDDGTLFAQWAVVAFTPVGKTT